MRDFTTISIVPAACIVTVDGETYQCAPFAIADVTGNTRTIPGDKVLALHWHGRHGHGHVEGFGAAEGFNDRTQVEPYLRLWLAARATAKRDAADALVRKRGQEQAMLDQRTAAMRDLSIQIAASGDTADRTDILRRHLATVAADHDRIESAMITDAHIAAAQADADAAETEAADISTSP